MDFGIPRNRLFPLYSETGRSSVDPEPMIRMLLLGYCYSIRCDRRLCQEVEMNLAYRWFPGLGFDQAVPRHSTFSKNRHGRFRNQGPFRDPFGELKTRINPRRLRLRRRRFASEQFLMAATAQNLERLVKHLDRAEVKPA